MEAFVGRKRYVTKFVMSGAAIAAVASLGLAPSAASASSVESTTFGVPLPFVQQSDCPSGSTLFTNPPGPLMAWNQQFNTGIVVPAGTMTVSRFWSWDGYEGRESVAAQTNEQWAISVGGSTSGLTPDIPDAVSSALIIGSLGSFSTSGGSIVIVHSSVVGPTDSSPNSVYPWAFCYRVQAPDTTLPPESTKVTTSQPDTTLTTTVTSVVSTSVTTISDETTTTIAEETTTTVTQPPTSVKMPPTTFNFFASIPPATNPDPSLKPAPTVPLTTTSPVTVAPTSAAPTTAAPATASPTTVPATVAPVAQVEGAVIEAAATEDLSYTGSSSLTLAGIGLGLSGAGLAVLLTARRRRV